MFEAGAFISLVSGTEGDVISEGQAGDTIHLVLAEGTDWHTPIQKLFNKHAGTDWAVLVLELQSGSARFHVLSPHTNATMHGATS
uniref:Uncharacterized protein n=1 Tax=Parascaris equorum TaxID=6256 RepID=A0A914S573_PAREQ